MIINEGNLDRVLRIILGISLLTWGVWNQSLTGAIVMTIGIVPLATGLMGWCPLYTLFNINTLSKKK